MNQDLSPEKHLIILWPNCNSVKTKLENVISENLTVLKVVAGKWEAKNAEANYSRFYQQNLFGNNELISHKGIGLFQIYIVLDPQPEYDFQKTSRGYELVNTNVFKLKSELRDITHGGHQIHSTNSQEELRSDVAMLWGIDVLDDPDFEQLVPEKITSTFGIDGFADIEEVFLLLNCCTDYLVLRNYEEILELENSEHPDIDLLISDVERARLVLNADPVFPENYRVHYKNVVNRRDVFWDLRCPVDGYMDLSWNEELKKVRTEIAIDRLDTKIFGLAGLDYYFSLAYHALIHKEEVSQDYFLKLSNLRGSDLHSTITTTEMLINDVAQFMANRNFYVTKPIDSSVFFNEHNCAKISGKILDVKRTSPDLEYQDGSEDVVLRTLINANDRSIGSDELAEAIVDWPTRCNFSRLRQELFMPFKIEKGIRVMEIGCGTGVNVRYFAELGAEVVGVEGNLTRARAARVRCEGMHNVTIFTGDANALPDFEAFDLVLLIGVLEHSVARGTGVGTPEKLLATASRFLKSDGALILAIENQIGLKYLLGYPDANLGIPWIGPEGFREASGMRTWSRAGLKNLLMRNGFSSQNWFYPYPDYKLPNFVASHDLYSTSIGKSALKSIVRAPVVGHSASSQLACDPIWASQTMIDADIGPDVSNSFLVIAGKQANSQKKFINKGLGWLASGERLSQWRSRRVLIESDGKLTLVLNPEISTEESTTFAWLKHINHNNVLYVEGENLEDEIIRGFVLNNLENVKDSLNIYLQFLKQNIVSLSEADKFENPFVIQDSIGLLDGVMLDCTPKNLILDTENTVHFIDKEWQTFGNVSLELVWYRGMTELAFRIMATATPTPFDPLATVSDLVHHLSSMVEAKCSPLIAKRYLDAEIELQRIVTGYDSTSAIHELQNRTISTVFMTNNSLSKFRQLAQLTTHIEELNHVREGELTPLSTFQHRIEDLTGELVRVRAERDSYLESWSVKIGLTITWPLRRLESLVRQLLK